MTMPNSAANTLSTPGKDVAPMSVADLAKEAQELVEILTADNEAYFCGQFRRVSQAEMTPEAREIFNALLPNFVSQACGDGCAMATREILAALADASLEQHAALLFLSCVIADAPFCFDLLADRVSPAGLSVEGDTLLTHAAQHASLRVAQRLLPLADPNAMNDDGTTALLRAAREGEPEMVALLAPRCLLSRGPDGKDALDVAVGSSHWASVDAMAPFLPAQRLAQVDNAARADLGDSLPAVMPAFNARWERELLLGVVNDAQEKTQDAPSKAPRSESRRI